MRDEVLTVVVVVVVVPGRCWVGAGVGLGALAGLGAGAAMGAGAGRELGELEKPPRLPPAELE